jgi:uncharacterized protein (DUF362 family)
MIFYSRLLDSIYDRFNYNFEGVENMGNRAINRRDFLKSQLKAIAWMTVGTSGLLIPRSLIAAETPDLSIVKGPPETAVRVAVDLLGGMKSFVKPGHKVVIKPNMSWANGLKMGTTTHPEVVRELVAMCKEAGALKVQVLDHTLSGPEFSTREIKAACAVFNEDIVTAVQDYKFYHETRISDSWFGFNKTDIIKDVLSADVLIAAPVAKHNHATDVSLSMKGMMGLVYDRWVMHQTGLDTAIVTLAEFLRPDLVVIDASRVLSSHGPSGPGKVLPMNMVIASRDMVAADAQAVKMFEWEGKRKEPKQVDHIRLAHKKGIGCMEIENLNVKQIEI